MNTREKFTYYFLHFLSRYLNKISDRKREWYANKLAAFAYKYLPIRKNEAYKNIKLAFPNQNHQWLKKVLKGSYKTAVQNFIDFLAVSTTVHKTVFTIKNKNVLDEALDKNKGVLLITGHFGLWEKWGAWLGKNKYPLWGIIQRQANRGSDLFFKEIRESYGMSHIYKTSSVDQSYKILKQNQILILASDQDAKDKGVKFEEVYEDYVNFQYKFQDEIQRDFDKENKNVNNIHGQEVALYSDRLGVAGRVDCIAEWNGTLSVIDFKTSRKPKKAEWIRDYYMQCAAYAAMYYERTGIPIKDLVIAVMVENDEPQIFHEKVFDWLPPLKQLIDNFGR